MGVLITVAAGIAVGTATGFLVGGLGGLLSARFSGGEAPEERHSGGSYAANSTYVIARGPEAAETVLMNMSIEENFNEAAPRSEAAPDPEKPAPKLQNVPKPMAPR